MSLEVGVVTRLVCVKVGSSAGHECGRIAAVFTRVSTIYLKRGSAYFGGALGSAVLHKKRLRNGST